MGNALGCGGLGERLAAAARDGDAAEARRLLAADPGLARCTSFGSLSSPLHFAAAKGHHEIAALLLENGADVNGKNMYGQTALMQACRSGHWEVVQTLLVFGSNVWRVDGLSGRTALHVAAAGGHVRCVRLLLAGAGDGTRPADKAGSGGDERALVDRAAGGGVTALHLAALHGHADCVHLLVDEGAGVDARTLPCAAAPMASIGAGSTPLHYAASGGEVKCCQILVSRGADRMAANCNGWLPVDVARMWERQWLEHVLSPKSLLPIPNFPPSGYLSLPLAGVLAVAREHGAASPDSTTPCDDGEDEDACAVCLERPCTVAAEGCGHELCGKCAMDLCTVIKAYEVPPGLAGAIPCPLCRSGIASFRKAAAAGLSCGCKDCAVQRRERSHRSSSCYAGGGGGGGGMDDREAAALPLYCAAPFTASAISS